MKGLRTMIASAVVIGLMLSSVGTALAEEPTETTAIFGKVIAKDQASSTEGLVEVKTKHGNVQIKLDAATQYKRGSLTDVSTGKKVALVASKANGTYIAKKVLVVPSEPTYLHLVGVVTSASETTATVSVSDKQGAGKATFTIATQPISAAPTPTPVEPGQYVTAVVSKDLRAMKYMTVRVTSAAGKAEVPPTEVPPSKYTEVPQPTKVAPSKVAPVKVVPPTEAETREMSTAYAKVTCVQMSPELVKEVCVATPSEVSRGTLMDMPSEKVKEVWINVPPELAKEVWLDTPPELAKKIWLRLSPEFVKNIWIDCPPELATEETWLDINSSQLKQIWIDMPPQLAKEIYLDLPPELAKEVWIHIPPEQIKQIWIHLPSKEVKQVWMEMPTPTEAAGSSAGGGAAGKVESVTIVPAETTVPENTESIKKLTPEEIEKKESENR